MNPRIIVSCLLILVLNVSQAQDSLSYGLCDKLPANFYSRNPKYLSIRDGMGYCIHHDLRVNEKIAKFKQLEEFDYYMSYMGWRITEDSLESIPSEIGSLKKLKKVSTNVPSSVLFEMSQLTSLDVRRGDRQKIDFAFDVSKLQNLEYLVLDIPKNQKGRIPGLDDLPNLKVLKLINASEIQVNQALKNTTLESVTLEWCLLNNMPLDELSNLKTLVLKKCTIDSTEQLIIENKGITSVGISGIENLNIEFKDCKNMKVLSFHGCNLKEIPNSVFDMTALEELRIPENSIRVISEDLGKLVKLKVFSSFRNTFQGLPSSIMHCQELEELSITYNPSFSHLPEEVGSCEKLRKININKCGLLVIPKSLEKCTKLEHINLEENKLEQVQCNFRDMKKLYFLNLSRNRLTKFPAGVHVLSSLQKINVSHNVIDSLPLSIGQMTSLVEFIVFRNNLTALPMDIGELEGLIVLSAYQNKIADLPPGIVRLSLLEKLYLGKNEIKNLPAGFDQLVSLRSLEIQHNPLTKFPNEIYTMKVLDRVWVTQAQAALAGFDKDAKNPMVIFTD